jgi:hypothetical protein
VLLFKLLTIAIADGAFDDCADAFLTFVCVLDPRPILPRRAVTHVLRVTAAQLRDPVPEVISVKAYDRRLHAACMARTS